MYNRSPPAASDQHFADLLTIAHHALLTSPEEWVRKHIEQVIARVTTPPDRWRLTVTRLDNPAPRLNSSPSDLYLDMACSSLECAAFEQSLMGRTLFIRDAAGVEHPLGVVAGTRADRLD